MAFRLFVACLIALSLAGCAPTRPPVAPAYAEEDGVPKYAPWLGLTKEQEPQVAAIVEDVKRAGAPIEPAVVDLLRTASSTIRQCKKDSPMLGLSGDGVVRAGEAARGPVLDAINELHALLTPVQRKRLSEYILDEDRESTRDTRQDKTDDETRSVGIDVDLSLGQIGAILLRMRKVQIVFEDEAEPWLERFRFAVKAFAKPDFDVREQQIADVPIFRMGVDMALGAYRLIVPILEPEQCKTIGEYAAKKLDERAERKAKEAEERQTAEAAKADDQT